MLTALGIAALLLLVIAGLLVLRINSDPRQSEAVRYLSENQPGPPPEENSPAPRPDSKPKSH